MTEPPPRKRFQFHLSTAIVMMFVAGGLIWANTRESEGVYNGQNLVIEPKYREHPEIEYYKVYECDYGVPFTVVNADKFVNPNNGMADKGRYWHEPNYFMASIDVIIALLGLLTTLFFCEWLIFRRAARK